MNLQAPHLFKSRHGVWYVRIVVPNAIRKRHPELPAELKRSTQTAVRRVAEAFSKKMCLEFETRFSNIKDLEMKCYFTPPLVQPMVIERDPSSGRITRLQTDPHDPPEVIRLLRQMVALEQRNLRTLERSNLAKHPVVAVAAEPSHRDGAIRTSNNTLALVERFDCAVAHHGDDLEAP
ncbi:MAG: DUF6538 domain-containing protein [Rhizobacter sp.]